MRHYGECRLSILLLKKGWLNRTREVLETHFKT
jgi:hypothetical protein